MKTSHFLFAVSFGFTGLVSAQTSGTANSKSTPASVKKDVVPKVYTVVNPDNYESGIVNGKLVLNQKLDKVPKSTSYTASYNIGSSNEKSLLFKNHLEIVMTNQFFETVFLNAAPEITAKSAILRKYVQDKNISLTDEKGWISLIKYYNDL